MPLLLFTPFGLVASQTCTVSTVAGPLVSTAGYTEAIGTNARFSSPRGIVVNSAVNELYVADSMNHRVRAVVISSGSTRVLTGSGTAASTDGLGISASHNAPFALALSSSGLLYVTDRAAGKIRRVTVSSTSVVTIGGTGTLSRVDGVGTTTATFSAPSGLALDEPGNLLYISDCISSSTLGALLRRLDLSTGQVTTIAGQSVTAAYLDGVGTNAKFQANMYSPLLVSPLLYLTDSASNRMRVFNTMSLAVTTVAGNGVSTDVSGVGLAAGFNGIDGIVGNSSGWFFVIELNGGTLRRVNNNTFAVDKLAFTGGVGNIDGACATATINSPQFITLDSLSGNLYMTDTANHNIRAVVTMPPSNSPTSTPSATLSPTRTPSASPSPPPCVAPAGSFCSGGVLSQCPSGTFSSASGATFCQACLDGHYCPIGTSLGARNNCGRGKWCPSGSSSPNPCPIQIVPPPYVSWTQHPLQVQGPAFLVETAACLNQCFWNFTSGDGKLSTC